MFESVNIDRACYIYKELFAMSAFRVIPFVAAAMLAACATSGTDKTYYGYEDDFVLPEPDMVPAVPDDRPGRTVDEMIRDGVTVNRARETAADDAVYERAGRFGTKEKVALRRGLNAPAADTTRNDRTRDPETDVRPLNVKENIRRDDLVFKSEQEMLEAVIKPRKSETVPIEVVGLDIDKKPETAEPAKEKTDAATEKDAPSAPVADNGPSAAELLKKAADEAEAARAKAAENDELLIDEPAPAAETQVAVLRGKAEELDDSPVVLTPPAEETSFDDEEEEIVLKEPVEIEEEEEIVLKEPLDIEEEEEEIRLIMPPEARADDFAEEAEAPIVLKMPSEIREETAALASDNQKPAVAGRQRLGLIRFSKNSALLPLSAGETIKEAAQTYDFNPEGRLLVVGYDAPNGKSSLAIKRAATASSALVAAGVPANKISRRAKTGTPDGEIIGSHAEIFYVSGGVIK